MSQNQEYLGHSSATRSVMGTKVVSVTGATDIRIRVGVVKRMFSARLRLWHETYVNECFDVRRPTRHSLIVHMDYPFGSARGLKEFRRTKV